MADTRISDFVAAGPLTGTEVVPGVQGGGNVKITLDDIAALATGGGGGTPRYIGFVSQTEATYRLPAGWTVDFIGSGECTINPDNLLNPAGDELYVVQATVQRASGVGQIGVTVNAGITNITINVRTQNSAGAGTDLDFFITIEGPVEQAVAGGGD